MMRSAVIQCQFLKLKIDSLARRLAKPLRQDAEQSRTHEFRHHTNQPEDRSGKEIAGAMHSSLSRSNSNHPSQCSFCEGYLNLLSFQIPLLSNTRSKSVVMGGCSRISLISLRSCEGVIVSSTHPNSSSNVAAS